MSGLSLKFWWNGDQRNSAIHWLHRDLMQQTKMQGGLGFRSYESLNEAMLMKQLWRLLTEPDSLTGQILK